MKKTIRYLAIMLLAFAVPCSALASGSSKTKKRKAKTSQASAKTSNYTTTNVTNQKDSSSNTLTKDSQTIQVMEPTMSVTAKVNNNGLFYHTVAKGETLQSIAEMYGATIKDVILWNDLADNAISPGQKLRIKSMDSADVSNYSQKNVDTNVVGVNVEDEPFYHTVAQSETLNDIAQLYGVSVRDLIVWNDLVDDNIIPGAKIVVNMTGNKENGEWTAANAVGDSNPAANQTIKNDETTSDFGKKGSGGAFFKISVGDTNAETKWFSGELLYDAQLGYNHYIADNIPLSIALGYLGRSSSINSVEQDFHSITMPIRVGYSYSPNGKIAFGLKAGVKMDYVVSGNIKMNKQKFSWSKLKKMTKDRQDKYSDFGIGANFCLSFSFYGYTISGEYNIGLIKNFANKKAEKYFLVGLGWEI